MFVVRCSLFVVLTVVASLGLSQPAQAYVLFPNQWASGKEPFDVYVDKGSFANLNGVSISDEATYWVGSALKEWKVRAGADFDVNLFNTINGAPCTTRGDGYNVVGVTTSSSLSVCGMQGALACERPKNNVWGNKVESDICIIANAATWEVVLSQLNTSKRDLVGVLVHEFGHFLGLNHSAATSVMKQSNFFTSAGRHLFGDDIAGVRAIFGSTGTQRKWRTWLGVSQTISSATSFGGTSNWQRTDGDVGGVSFSSVNRYVVSTALNRAGTRQYFDRAVYPLNSSSTWTSNYVSTDSWTTAGIATNDQLGSSAKWIAYWPRKTYDADNVCEFAGVVSSNAFSSYSTSTMPGCSLLPPSIAHDPNAGRFVMLWKHFGGDFFNTGRIHAATSTNGFTWTPAQDLGIYTLDAPSIDCHASTGCLLSHVSGSLKMPRVVTQKLTISSGTGAITKGIQTVGLLGIQHTPAVAPYWLPGGSGNHFLVLAQLPSGVQRARGTGSLLIHTDDSNPPDLNVWGHEGIFLKHPTAYAGRRTSDFGFILTAD